MSYQAKIKRYIQILQLVGNKTYPSICEMIEKINDTGLKVSDRQLKRDIESLRDEFGLNIQYSAHKRGYFLKEDLLTFPYFMKILEYSQNTEILKYYLREGANLFEIIEFEDFNSFKGILQIKEITLAIKNTIQLLLKYKRFDVEIEKEYMFNPYLLREYQNRWYVIGTLQETEEIRTFGLDRITGIQYTGNRFTRNKKIDIPGLFMNVIGINVSADDRTEDIQLWCLPYMGNLLKTLPLHHSQMLVKETKNEIIFSYKMVVNLELKQRLLMIANQAKVIQPLTLKTEIEKLLLEAQKFYKKIE